MRDILFLILLIALVIPVFGENLPLEGKDILFVIPSEFFRDEELIVPSSNLNSLGAATLVASTTLEEVEGMMGMLAKPDILIEDIEVKDFDAIILVGGIGAEKLWNNETLHGKLKEFDKKKKLIGAICLAPVILSRAGLLIEKKATCFPTAREEMEKDKVIYQARDVVVSGHIVTANGPEAAEEFSKVLSRILIGSPQTKIHD